VAGRRRRSGPQFSPILAALLIGSLVAGIAVTYLAAPASQNVAPGRGPTPESPTIVIDISVALFLLIVGGVVVYAALAPRAIRVSGAGETFLAVFVVALAFLLLVHFLVPSAETTVPKTPSNSTGPGGPVAPNLTTPNGTFGPLPFHGFPGWTAYIILGLVALAAIRLLGPALRARGIPPSQVVPATQAVRRSLESALASLQSSEPEDARQIIIGLYARLLETVGPYLANLSTATPREIEQVVTHEFGIPNAPAADLTRLFEEARYSTHPFTDEQVARARRALEAALLHVKIRSYTGGG
jgi:hypothetical protein